MSEIWQRIKQLEGQTLFTARQQKPFHIDHVGDDAVFYTPAATGKGRFSGRDTFEKIMGLGLKQHEVTRSLVSEEALGGDRFNSSYIHAILCRLGRAA